MKKKPTANKHRIERLWRNWLVHNLLVRPIVFMYLSQKPFEDVISSWDMKRWAVGEQLLKLTDPRSASDVGFDAAG